MSLITKSEAKAKRGRIVASRYKQAAEEVSKLSSRDSTKCTTTLSSDKASAQSSTTMWGDESILSKCEGLGKTTSTPEKPSRNQLPSLDASAISEATSFLCVPGLQQKTVAPVNLTNVAISVPKYKVHTASKAQATSTQSRKGISSTTDEEIAVYYAKYLQAKLNESNIKRATTIRCKEAMKKIEDVWCLIQFLMGKQEAAVTRMNFASYLLTLNKQLNKQENLIVPALQVIPNLESQYEDIAASVDIVSHKLEVKNDSVPSDITEEELISLLNQIKSYMGDIEISLQNAENIVTSATMSDKLAIHGKLISEEMKRCSELLYKAEELLLSETNFRVGCQLLPLLGKGI